MAGLNYAKGKPVGNNQIPFYDSPPPVVATATTVRDNAAASSILILNQNTTAVEVAARGAPAYIKWYTQAIVDSSVAGTSIISAAGTANFDGVVPADQTRRFIIPIATHSYAEAYGSAVGANVANGLYTHMATIGAASVAVIEN